MGIVNKLNVFLCDSVTNIKHNANRENLLREAGALTEERMLNEKGPIKAKPVTAFHLFYNANDLAREYAEKYGLELKIYD